MKFSIVFSASVLLVGIYLSSSSVLGHTHHLHNTHKEREEDGAFSPRDHGHHAGEEGHNTEFDHESILGEFLLCLANPFG